MSFDEQPYSKEDHDLHDACEEIKRLKAELLAQAERVAALQKVYEAAKKWMDTPSPDGHYATLADVEFCKSVSKAKAILK